MDGFAGSPAFQFFESLAEIFQGLIVDELHLSFRGHDRYDASNPIDHQAQSLFALTDHILRAFALGDVRSRSHELQATRFVP